MRREIQLNLLGGFELLCHGRHVSLPLPAQRLLAFLALQDRPLLRSYVASVLWSDSTERHAGGNLRSALWRLTRSGCSLAQLGDGRLQLAPDVTVDVRLGRAQALRLRGSNRAGEHDLSWCNLRADLLPDWYDEWVIVEREAFRQTRMHALEALCHLLTQSGSFDQAIDVGLAAVAADPLRETAQRVLIRAYLAEGNAGSALKQFDSFCRLLEEQLGLEPSRTTKDLVRADRLTIG